MKGIRFHLSTNSGISEVVSRKFTHIYIYIHMQSALFNFKVTGIYI